MSAPSQYEFDSRQNEIIARLSRAMLWVGAPLLVVGLIYGLAGVVSVIQAIVAGPASAALAGAWTLLAAAFFCALGIWTRNAAHSFHRIVATTGRDIDNLMDALGNLGKLYSLLSLLVKIYIVLIFVGLIITLVFWTTAAFRS